MKKVEIKRLAESWRTNELHRRELSLDPKGVTDAFEEAADLINIWWARHWKNYYGNSIKSRESARLMNITAKEVLQND